METGMNRKELLEKLRTGASAYDRFAAPTVKPELLSFRPALEDAWTIQEQLNHVLDSEMSLFLRIRQAIANPGSDVHQAFSLENWKERFNHPGQSTKDTVETFKRIHLLAYELLKALEDKDWSDYSVNHATRGKQTLDDILKTIAGHVDFHIELIERNEKLWREKNG